MDDAGMALHSRKLDDLATHPRITALLDHLLLPNPLITAFQAIKIHPGSVLSHVDCLMWSLMMLDRQAKSVNHFIMMINS
jgi:hypothetical protein